MKADRVIAVRTNKTVYRDGDTCVKVFGRGYSKSDVYHEAMVQSAMEDVGIPTPGVKEIGTVDGKWAISYEYVRGKSLDRLLIEHPERSGEYIRIMADLHLTIHKSLCPPLRLMTDLAEAKASVMEPAFANRRRICELIASAPQGDKICHGDFRPCNIVIADDGAPYVLDWALTARGDHLTDVALSYLLLVFHGYTTGAEEYLSRYCTAAEVAEDTVRARIPVAAATRLVNANKEERDFMLSYIKEKKQ